MSGRGRRAPARLPGLRQIDGHGAEPPVIGKVEPGGADVELRIPRSVIDLVGWPADSFVTAQAFRASYRPGAPIVLWLEFRL